MVVAMTALLDIQSKNKTINRMTREFIVPAARRKSALAANPEAVTALRAVIAKALRIKRKSAVLGEEDTPRIPPVSPGKSGK